MGIGLKTLYFNNDAVHYVVDELLKIKENKQSTDLIIDGNGWILRTEVNKGETWISDVKSYYNFQLNQTDSKATETWRKIVLFFKCLVPGYKAKFERALRIINLKMEWSNASREYIESELNIRNVGNKILDQRYRDELEAEENNIQNEIPNPIIEVIRLKMEQLAAWDIIINKLDAELVVIKKDLGDLDTQDNQIRINLRSLRAVFQSADIPQLEELHGRAKALARTNQEENKNFGLEVSNSRKVKRLQQIANEYGEVVGQIETLLDTMNKLLAPVSINISEFLEAESCNSFFEGKIEQVVDSLKKHSDTFSGAMTDLKREVEDKSERVTALKTITAILTREIEALNNELNPKNKEELSDVPVLKPSKGVPKINTTSDDCHSSQFQELDEEFEL